MKTTEELEQENETLKKQVAVLQVELTKALVIVQESQKNGEGA